MHLIDRLIDEARYELRQKAVATTISKPQLRGLLKSSIKKHLTIAVCLSLLGGLSFKVLVADVRKRKYAEFYRTYDTEKAFNEMRRKGLFQSC